MSAEYVIPLVFFGIILFLLFGAPYFAEKQAQLDIAKWEREEKEKQQKQFCSEQKSFEEKIHRDWFFGD